MISRIILFVLVLIAIGLFFGYINPTYTGRVAQLKQDIQNYDSALVAAKNFTAKENELITQRNAIPAEGLARVEAFLPDGVDNVQLILDLNALAARSGITLSNFDTSASVSSSGKKTGDKLALVADGPVESLNLSVSATGTYAAFKSFLQAIEWSLRPLDLIDVTIDDSKTGVYTYTMMFRIYWLR